MNCRLWFSKNSLAYYAQPTVTLVILLQDWPKFDRMSLNPMNPNKKNKTEVFQILDFFSKCFKGALTFSKMAFSIMTYSILYYGMEHNNTEHNGIQYNGIQHYGIQHYGIQHYGIQHCGIQHYGIQHSR
jgi:hypothetical protein